MRPIAMRASLGPFTNLQTLCLCTFGAKPGRLGFSVKSSRTIYAVPRTRPPLGVLLRTMLITGPSTSVVTDYGPSGHTDSGTL